MRLAEGRPLLPSDLIDFFLKREGVERRERQTQEEADASVESSKSLAESSLNFFGRSFHGRWIWYAPVRGHRLARPDGTDLTRGVVADGKDKVQVGLARP